MIRVHFVQDYDTSPSGEPLRVTAYLEGQTLDVEDDVAHTAIELGRALPAPAE